MENRPIGLWWRGKKHLLALVALLSPLLVFLLLVLPACSQSQKATPAPPFELTNQFGEMTSLSQLRGKVVVLTFLYGHCSEVCPLIISKVQQAMTELGTPATEGVALLAVTVDPERDAVDGLRESTSSLPFNWSYLTGEPGQLKVAWDNYGIYVEPQKGKTIADGQSHDGHQGYDVIHTAKVVLIDRDGYIGAELIGQNWQAEELRDKLGRLLAGQEITGGFHPWQSLVSFIYRCGPVSFSSFGGAVTHFLFMLSIPAVLFGLYRLLIR